MVHWIWLIVAVLAGGVIGAFAMGLLAANHEDERRK